MLIASLNVENGFGHNPDFEIITSEDILKFCEFFYEEYELLGADDLARQHPNFPNLRACVILYNHVAWDSAHEARDVVLIAEIENYLGDSSYIKERHIEYSNNLPNWIKSEAQLWIDDEIQDVGFAYGIRALLEAKVLTLNFADRICNENNLCVKEGDFIEYSHSDKYGDVVIIKHEVESINDNEIKLNIQKTSQYEMIKEDIILDRNGLRMINECCYYYEFVIPTPINLWDKISENMKVVSQTTYTLDNQVREAWLASDLTGQNTKIIDKKTGLVFVHKIHETEVLTVGDEIKIIDTNLFETKYNMNTHETVIPDWWKTTTTWLLAEEISDEEYLRAMEELLSRSILRV